MTQKARLAQILTQLNQKQTLSLHDIMVLTGTSRDTARRDIIKLADSQLVERNYGGISLPNTFSKLDQYLDRQNDLLPIKRALARRASALLTGQRFLFLDVSSTVTCLPQYLTANDAGLLVTNSLDVADQALRHATYRTRILGGSLNAEQRCVQGADSLLALTKFHFDTAVLSCAGITAAGVYYAYEDDIALKAALRQQSTHLMLLVDHTKVNVTHNFRLFAPSDFDTIVTDQPLPADLTTQIPADRLVVLEGETNHD
ncbi:DeoR/GlpR family DNA-binding transcription regulator [Levilactobacillus acidifarinae]|uniref:Transcription regulator n=1 Tax=Levilactobacillus acidifarinae DSM 19394 = JCM 15949 TaxID=1423715 RepID=A0A0R1LNY3_9LACO|nr:DeoR/GlpR family DNA-binding transcription regulator [Levilactobacillus acidifarinae]KRK94513.1 transcription regulator [Levilactobacillus acidifarinae DSM 19394]GEO68261.1 DeoR family transcriptional regulator [Levilactobacillus acidifarinae]